MKKYQPKICLTCSKEIPYEKRMNQFCSHSCSATFHNKNRITRKKNETCLFCGKSLRGISGLKYCTKQCQIDYQRKQVIEKWQKGKFSGNSGKTYIQLSAHIRSYLFKKYDNKCAKCGWGEMNPYSKKIPLETEHIDGNFENNKEENLTLLCPNCHSLTPTAKGANKGHGRYYRRERYKKGKSF
jgi:predicted nucleic acid-binding Zn ribbon protein